MKPGLKNPIMRTVNYLLYLSMCGLIGTGALLTWKLPPGSRGGRGLSVLDMDRHQWGDIHFWIAVVCVGLTACHLLLNWQWIWKIAASKYKWRILGGFALGLIIILGIYALPLHFVQSGSYK